MTLQQFIEKYDKKKIDWDNAYGGQCVDLYRQYCKEVLNVPQSPSVTGAADIWTSYLPEYFDQIKNTPEFVPQAGDIMIWNKKAGGGYGHVGVVTQADINGFTSFDQNWKTISVCELIKHNYSNVYGVIRPKKTASSELEACMSDRQKFWEERDQARAEAESLKHDLEAKSTEAKEIRKELDTFVETLASKLTTIADKAQVIGAVERLLSQESEMTQKLSKAEKAYTELEEQKRAEIDQLKKEIEDVKAANTKMASIIDRLEGRIAELEVPAKATQSLLDILKGLFEAWKGKYGKEKGR